MRMAMKILMILPFWTVSGCASAPLQPAPSIAGGWHQVAPDAPEVQVDAQFATAQLSPPAPLAQVEKARQQVVAGTNVTLVLRLADGRRWQVVVWRKLDGTREMTSAAPLPALRP